MIDLELVKETYARMPDEKLIAMLQEDAMNISYEAFLLLKREYNKRKLDPVLFSQAEADRQEQSKEKVRRNFLREEDIETLSRFDVIVSNPPYVKRNEAEDMRTNVFLYEPHVALFVPDEDALLFYRHIARFANSHLNENGCLYVEINELHAEDVADLFRASCFRSIEIKKDMQGKDRMIKATRG